MWKINKMALVLLFQPVLSCSFTPCSKTWLCTVVWWLRSLIALCMSVTKATHLVMGCFVQYACMSFTRKAPGYKCCTGGYTGVTSWLCYIKLCWAATLWLHYGYAMKLQLQLPRQPETELWSLRQPEKNNCVCAHVLLSSSSLLVVLFASTLVQLTDHDNWQQTENSNILG